MAEMITRKLPAGIQFFSIIRKEGYLYVDKTDLVWQLTHSGDLYNYLSRPRRFGKSLLLDTLQCYFEGKKYDEVAEILGLSRDGIRKNIMKGLALLRNAFSVNYKKGQGTK